MRRLILALTLAGALPLSAHASDTVLTFNLVNGTLDDGTDYGSVVIDTTTGTVLSENFTLDIIGETLNVNFSGSDITQVDGFNGGTQTYFDSYYYSTSTELGEYYFDVDLPVPSLVGYTGGLLCSNADTCVGGYSGGIGYSNDGFDHQDTGSLVAEPVGAPTPEPSSLVLLGTGALSLAGAARRRFRRS